MSEEASEQMRVGSGKRKWVPMDHSKSKKHESKGEQTDDHRLYSYGQCRWEYRLYCIV